MTFLGALLGFDVAPLYGTSNCGMEYRNILYVRRQVRDLAKQLQEIRPPL